MQRLVSSFVLRITSIGADRRQSALASSCSANKIQDPTTGCKLHQPKSTVVSAGTLCAGFSGAGASALMAADQLCLVVNRCRLSSMQKREFAVAGPMVWNDLPVATCVLIARNRNSSKIMIKTYVFNTVMK